MRLVPNRIKYRIGSITNEDGDMRLSAKDILVQYCGGRAREVFTKADGELLRDASEVRLRADKPLIIKKSGGEIFLGENGGQARAERAFRPSMADIAASLDAISQYSLYAFEEELRHGFITLPGGNRVGVCGKAVTENGSIKTQKNISCLNIRLAREVKCCADQIIKIAGRLGHTMIISPPGRGKTTLLRDLIRQQSDGGRSVGVIDERSELAACYLGEPQLDLGARTDVLDGGLKAEGIRLMLRSMSPEIIAVDELGGPEDFAAIEDVLCAGVTLICTAHGASVEDVRKKPILREIIGMGLFEMFVVLSATGKIGTIEGIYDSEGKKIG